MTSREETEAIWERITKLEEKANSLEEQLSQDTRKMSENVAFQIIALQYNLMLAFTTFYGLSESYISYMRPKVAQAQKEVVTVGSIGEIFKITREFNNDCVQFAQTLGKQMRTQ